MATTAIRFAVNRISIGSNTIGELQPSRQEGSRCGRIRPHESGKRAVRLNFDYIGRLTPEIDLCAPSSTPIHHRLSNRVSPARYVQL